jgi:hypothetical protein
MVDPRKFINGKVKGADFSLQFVSKLKPVAFAPLLAPMHCILACRPFNILLSS